MYRAFLAANGMQPQDDVVNDEQHTPNRNTIEDNDQPGHGDQEESLARKNTLDYIEKHVVQAVSRRTSYDGTDTRHKTT